jgi:hypothetical protein
MMTMKESTKLFLSTLFYPGEPIYASPDKYSSKKNELTGEWEIYRPSIEQKDINEETTVLVGINPIQGLSRNDSNVTARRNFLLEADEMALPQQKPYMDKLGIPYSIAVYSGSRSIHFGVCLEENISEVDYKFYAKWLYNIAPKLDPHIGIPSKGIRFPGVQRPKGKKQVLIEPPKGKIPLEQFLYFLSKYERFMPKPEIEEDIKPFKRRNAEGLADWVKTGLRNGFSFEKGRNNGWFSVAYEFSKWGYNYEETEYLLKPYFTEEPGFRLSEWRYTLKNGYNKAKRKYWK